jgi:hypothetical protein
MIGFIVTPTLSLQISNAVREAQVSRGLQPYLHIEGMPITTGEHEGKHFLPFDNTALQTHIYGNTRLGDHPEFATLVSMLGGMSARIDLDPATFHPATP